MNPTPAHRARKDADRALAFPQARLIIFAKAPVPGRVKTRLRRRLGAAGAAHIYKRLCQGVIATAAASATAPLELHASPDRAHPWLWARAREWNARLRVQTPGHLGSRMANALAGALQDAPFALIVGADCAGLRGETIHRAFAALEGGSEVVLTPAEDGGYALIGMRGQVRSAVFSRVHWGSDRVLSETHRNARQAGIGITEVDSAWDVDCWRDVKRWRREARRSMRP